MLLSPLSFPPLTPGLIRSTSSLTVDFMLGGGFLGGSIVEIYGEEDVGKTSIALGTMAQIPDYEHSTLYIDLEKTLFAQHARHFGLNPNAVNVARPDTTEHTLALLKAAVLSKSFRLIVVDSVPALISSNEMAQSISLDKVKSFSAAFVLLLKELLIPLAASNCTLILINQLRNYPSYTNPDVYFETSPGGLTLKALCTTRLKLEHRAQFVDPSSLLATVDANVEVIKHLPNAPTINPTNFRIVYSQGFENNLGAKQLAEHYNLTTTGLQETTEALNLHKGLQLNYSNY